MPVPRAGLTTAYRWAVVSRCLAAAIGGFALASAISIVVAWLVVRSGWASRASATAGATMLGFAVWTAVVLWAFHTASLRRVWLKMSVPALVLGALAGWLGRGA